jgi:hypothetical protein
MTLLAYCKNNQGNAVKRIPMTNPVQQGLENLFADQENNFRVNRPNEVEFNGDWKPDEDELITLDVTPEVNLLVQAAEGNALALPVIDTANFESEGIKAIFTSTGNVGATRLRIQRFTGQQLLNRRRALLLQNNNFRELYETAFTIGTSLACVVENGLLKFDSYHNLRAIFDLSEFFEEATDEDIDEFSAHASISIQDVVAFKGSASQTIRKLVHKVLNSDVLSDYTPQEIQQGAAAVGLGINLNNGAIEVPDDKALARRFLRFLDDGVYEAPLTGNRYVTNSKKAI